MYSLAKSLSVFTLLFISISAFAIQTPTQPTTSMSFFDGTITAKLTWLSLPSTVKPTQLKIELINASNEVYDVDPSLISVGLFMPAMPDMGIEQQNVFSMSDASGSPIPGFLIATDIIFSMQGRWEIQLTLPNPKDQNQTEIKAITLFVK